MIPISYNVRSLVVRKTTTLATVLGIALVVFVLASSLMLSNGVNDTLARGGGDESAVVIRKGSDNELSSIISVENVSLVLSAPGVKKGTDGNPIGVGEVILVAAIEKIGTEGGMSNVTIRGVPDNVKIIRPNVKIIAGRQAAPGTDEAMVGRAIRGRFKGIQLDQQFEPRKNRPMKIVGVFSDNGSAYESEVWADLDTTRAAFGREGIVSSVRVVLESPSSFDAFEAAVEQDKRIGLEAMTEGKFNAKQGFFTSIFVMVLGTMISIFFSIGAMIGAMITMYASVANRQKEIGTMRALGFPRRTILFSFLLEALMISGLAGVIGAVASMAMGTVRFSMMNFATFSELVFRFTPTPGILLFSVAFALGMGLIGGLLPAIRAARMSPVEAMRQ